MSNDKLTIRIEPANDNEGVPIDKLADMLIAHQKYLEVIVRADDENATVPEIRVVKVREGSFIFEGAWHGLQTLLPFAKPLLGVFTDKMQAAFNPNQEISLTQSVKMPKSVYNSLSQPVKDGIVKSVMGFVDDSPIPAYEITPESFLTNEKPELTEYGDEQEQIIQGKSITCIGKITELNWDKKTGYFVTLLDGNVRKIKCTIQDADFLQERVNNNIQVELLAIPTFRVSAMGESKIVALTVLRARLLE